MNRAECVGWFLTNKFISNKKYYILEVVVEEEK